MNACEPKQLLVVWHSRTGTARQMAEAAAEGARDALAELGATQHVRVVSLPAAEATAEHLLRSDAFVFAAPENLAGLSGQMKEFFDRNYYAVLEQLNGRPYGLLVAAGSDGAGAVAQAERIATGWRLRRALPPVVVNTSAQTPEAILAMKPPLRDADREACRTTGGTLAALLA